ncbi:MAG: arginine--tRNA ligase [Thermodesulfobacteriota bacterium]
MRARLAEIISGALDGAVKDGAIKNKKPVIIEKPKKEEFGDFSTNLAMLLAPLEKRSPREVAAELAGRIAASPEVTKCEVAGPGFINIFLEHSFWLKLLTEILEKSDTFGDSDVGAGKKVQVEFVSANPTGPLHIGHGRGAAVGVTLARVLEACGFEVTREYYVNDLGLQMEILGESVRLRREELSGKEITFPDDHYKGEYIKEIAGEYDKEVASFGKDDSLPTCGEFAADAILYGIKKDLSDFGVEFDVWCRESSLDERGLIAEAIDALKEKGFVEERDGATWFLTETKELGDDKDRVLIKTDGQRTYLASDVAYHREKLQRGFDTIVDVWGADHHGYQGRIKAVFKAFGEDEKKLKVIFIQLVSLLRDGEPVAMSTRAGEFVTLREVMDEVGSDACRFFFLMRKSDAHLDFDLEVAKKAAPENPVFYVQYCHARIHSIMAFALEKGVEMPEEFDDALLGRLELKDEVAIIKQLGGFGEVVERAALEMEPHRVTFYLQDLAGLFHPYYNRTRVVTDDLELSRARLLLSKAVATVVARGLNLLGVSAPVKM